MPMDLWQKNENVGWFRRDLKGKEESAVQSFESLGKQEIRLLEAVYSIWKTGVRTGKKFSVLHKRIIRR